MDMDTMGEKDIPKPSVQGKATANILQIAQIH